MTTRKTASIASPLTTTVADRQAKLNRLFAAWECRRRTGRRRKGGRAVFRDGGGRWGELSAAGGKILTRVQGRV